ncbi:MAG TPA: TonB-dependent siderophore receptor [Rhodanobacter sp.]|nr:TonB-dependent siderophore receptor [Rhodanobacter sp.]
MTISVVSVAYRFGKMRLLCVSTLLLLAAFSGTVMAVGSDQSGGSTPPERIKQDNNEKATNKKDATTLQTVEVTAYVPQTTNAAAKMDVPLIETPQSITVIPRAQMDLLDWQNLGDVVRYTAGALGNNFGSQPQQDWLTQRGFPPTEYINGLQAPIPSETPNVGVDLYGFQTVELLKGPSSMLYGSAPPGGIMNLTSRRPEGFFDGQAQLQYGSYGNTQVAADVTGPLDQSGKFLGRLTALYFDRGTQTYGVDTDRYYIAPAFTWLASPDTTLTFLSYFQHDDDYGDGNGFLPIYGILLPNPLGKISTSTNPGDLDYNHFKRNQYGVGYALEHKFNDTWRFEQNFMYFSNKAEILQVYGGGLVTDSDGIPVDYRTLNRYNFPENYTIRSPEIDSRIIGKFDTGDVKQSLIMGLGFRHYTYDDAYGFSSAPPFDIFNPVYGVPISTPPLVPDVQMVQKQTGIYGEDVIKINDRWVITVGGREDYVDSTNFGVNTSQTKFTYHTGLNYLFKDGFAPYVSYATSFQPTPGADINGNAFKPTAGAQVEAGLKFQPASLPPGMHMLVTFAAYDLKQNNVLTPDPTNPLFSVQAGQVEVKGLELEGVARLGDRWAFNFAYTDMNPVVSKSNTPDEVGKQLPTTPRHVASALADYTMQAGTFAGLGASLGVRYVGSSYGDSLNSPEFKAGSATLWDSTVHYNFGRDWAMQLNFANMFDRTYVSQCFSEAGCFYGLRRVVNFTITRNL